MEEVQQSKRAVGHNDVYDDDDAVERMDKDVNRTWWCVWK